ncbi:small integral membrane protein 26 [Mus pahari]|uniref:small integral membrane protein 26 n=1 Tax=Mus pahari TaxID=10093 RepID=UPI000A3075D4|nr:small integral membrane protein 26 [Mus pahari]
MQAEKASLWYRRMSFVYALGAWSVLGSAFFLSRKKKASDCEDQEDGTRNETPLSTSEDSDLAMERVEHREGFYVKSFLKYSENSVPVTQRILTYLKSWTDGPGPQV